MSKNFRVIAVLLFFSISYAYEVPIKDVVIQNRSQISYLQSKISEQNERIDGLVSLVESMNKTIQELKEAQTLKPQNDNTKLLKELASMIDKINSDYVSKSELKELLSKYNTSGKNSANNTSLKTKPISSSTPKELYTEAMKLYMAKNYEEATKRFLICDKKSYKSASSNFYLGEIAYYSKSYSDAIFYYKKSASLSSSASYMPVLILHTAISLDKTGHKDEAKLFYQNVIDNYADTKSAKIAKDRLERL